MWTPACLQDQAWLASSQDLDFTSLPEGHNCDDLLLQPQDKPS